ncbi:MAG: hypothetical protein E2O68_08195 [Deltaproteobacteria bacterium]|nr:MAG: hypothetical protein E2O68_08195 [Deltaproteobacteria bacterium]
MGKIINVIDTAYRATLEEQDDTSLWFTRACKNAGADMDILLTGNAVNYVVRNQNPHALYLGKGAIPHPSKFQDDLSDFIKSGGRLYFLNNDLEERGIESKEIIEGAQALDRTKMASFLDTYENIWHW